MPRAILSETSFRRAQAQVVAAQVRDVTGQVQATDNLANAINNSIEGTIIDTLQTKLDHFVELP